MTFERTKNDLKTSLEQLEIEKGLRTEFEKKACELEVRTEDLDTKLKDASTGLSKARCALADVTKDLNKQHTRRMTLEKRAHTLYVKSSRLQTKLNKTLNESNGSAADSEELTLTAEAVQRNHQLEKEIGELHEHIHQSRDVETKYFLQLEEERNAHIQTCHLLESQRVEVMTLRMELAECKKNLEVCNKELTHTRQEREALRERLRRAARKIDALDGYKKGVRKTLTFIEKKSYTPSVRACVRNMVNLSCPMSNVGPVFDGIYQFAIKPILTHKSRPEKIVLDPRTVSRIVSEGGIAADIQTIFEMRRTSGKHRK